MRLVRRFGVLWVGALLVGLAGCGTSDTQVRSSCVGHGVKAYTTEHGSLALWPDETCK